MANLSSKSFRFDEMMVHVPLCSHNNIKSILVVGEVSLDFQDEINKHNINKVVYTNNLNIDNEIFDIILYVKETPNSEQLQVLNKLLNQTNGILVTKSSSAFKKLDELKKQLQTVAQNFWICMPYSFAHTTLIFASKKFHPQAQIVLQVSDLLEDCNYYNTELHNACFVYPTYITQKLTGIAKR